MKTRTGFVSNSSSSSFIIGVGVVTKEDDIKEMKKLKDDNYGIIMYPLFDVISQEANSWDTKYDTRRDSFSIESFTYDSVSIEGIEKTYQENPLGYAVTVDIGGGDDSDFAVYDSDGEYSHMEYDIDFDFFDKDKQELIAKCEDICDKFDYTYGAGRNG